MNGASIWGQPAGNGYPDCALVIIQWDPGLNRAFSKGSDSNQLATPGILSEPRPFILQTALNDFYVTYELNAYTREPARMPELYSELHANIQDTFNEAGVEIMSPHATMLRDANKAAIPDAYRS